MQWVRDYKAGNLERQYPSLDAAEDTLHNYDLVPRVVQRLPHPHEAEVGNADPGVSDLAQRVLDFVRERGSCKSRHVRQKMFKQKTEHLEAEMFGFW